MEFYVELKLRSDAHNDGFSNGLSSCDGESTRNLVVDKEQTDYTEYHNKHGHHIKLHHKSIAENVWEVRTEFQNTSKEEIVIEMISSFAIKGVELDRIYRLQSFWSAEGKLKVETIEDLNLEKSWNGCGMRIEKFGNLGSMPVRKYFPFIVVEDTKSGTFIGIQLYIASSWEMELFCRREQSFSLVGGIADREFGHWFKILAPDETFITPKAIVARGNSFYDVCDKLVNAQKPNIASVDFDMGIAFNEYCTTWGNPSFENIQKICNRLQGKGVKYLVIDSGWYGNSEYWWTCIGDWDINEIKFPGGLKQTADYIRKCGMIPGLWYEFESVGKGSKYYNCEHLLKKDGVIVTVGEKRFWDMEDPWVIDYLSEKVIALLKECGFGYLKVDYNDSIGIGCDGYESLGEGLRRKILGTQEFFRKIKAEIPELVIENCSSGGHRLEPSMMELVSQASFSDAHETLAIPIIAANLHRVIKPSQSQIWAVLRKEDSLKRIQYSMINTLLGRMCLSGDIYDLSEEQWNTVDEGICFYKKAAQIIQHGKTITCECTTKSYNHPTGYQILCREYQNERLIVIHQFAENSKMDLSFINQYKKIAEYGKLDGEFSAIAFIVQ